MYGYWFDSRIWKFNKHYMAIEPIGNGLASDDLFDIISKYTTNIDYNPIIASDEYHITSDYIVLINPIITSDTYDIMSNFYIPKYNPYIIADNTFYIRSAFSTYVKIDTFIGGSSQYNITSNFNV